MKRILPVIVIAQFFCTSLWFAGNAVMSDIVRHFNLKPDYLVHLASIVQFGFITGTLIFAILSIADRFSPSIVFFCCAIVAALFNLGIIIPGISITQLMAFRFCTGFFLAGIYPVGMKIASDYYQQGLGKSLGFLVGALVLGTAFPHLLKSIGSGLPWKYVVIATSILSLTGGLLMFLLVPDGPNRKRGQRLRWSAFTTGFKNKNFRAATIGYVGHMWELYAFWVFVPVILMAYHKHYSSVNFNVSFLSFCIIAAGSIACGLSGFIAERFGAKQTASGALLLSGICCLISPFMLFTGSFIVLTLFLFFWSMVVIADSPLFSTLVAQSAPAESKGGALTIATCLGFGITIVSIQLINVLVNEANVRYIYMLLAIGPILGLVALFRNNGSSAKTT